MKESAVLLITFNRPETTIEVLKALQIAKPKVLYVFSDGPRSKEDNILRDKVQSLVDEYVIWECKLYKQIMDKNLGCGPGPIFAMNWAFEHEDRIIILEDDCVPSPAFFPYCNYLLEKYLNDERIWMISGDNACPEYALSSDYIFTNYPHSWGWATWKRCFEKFDPQMINWPEYRNKKMLYSILPPKEAHFFEKKYDSIFKDKNSLNHIWDFQFGFSIRANGGLGIMPRVNLIKNIGYMGTHSNKKGFCHDRAVDDNYQIVTEPLFIVADYLHDRYHFKHHWGKMNRITSIKMLIKIILKKLGLYDFIYRLLHS